MEFEILDKINLIDALSHAGLKMKPALYEIENILVVKGNDPTVIATELTEQEAVEKLIERAKKSSIVSPRDSFRQIAHTHGFRVSVISHHVTDKEGKVLASGREDQIHHWAVEFGIYDRYIKHLTNSES